MSYPEFLLFGHLVFVAFWVGTDVSLQLFALRARIAGPERMATFLGDVEWIGLRLLSPSSLLVVIFGVLLVIEDPNYELSQAWVTLGLIAFLASAITGAGFLGPETGRIGKLIDARGADNPEAQLRIARVFLISRIELVILIFIILDMVVKPGFP
jgi:uncharacterized membrane protein